MTKEDWEEFEQRLKHVGWPVRLDCDGYHVTVVRARIREMKDVIGMLIGGDIDPEWAKEDCEERRRFFRSREAYVYTRKSRENWKKLRPSEQQWLAKQRGPGFNVMETRTVYSPFWPSTKKLQAHLIKNNKEIRMIGEEWEQVRNGTW